VKNKSASSHKKHPGARGTEKTSQAARAPVEGCFRAVFESSRDAIGVSKAGVHVIVNPAYLELFGFPPGTSLAGKPVLDLIAPGSRDRIKGHILHRGLGEPVPSTYETQGLRADGSEFDMEVNVSAYQEEGQDHTLVILRDVTARKRDEQEIAKSDAMLRQIMDTASVAIFLVDKSGRIFHANRCMTEMFGCPMEELLGSEYVDHVHPAERETGRRKMLALLASEIPAVNLERLYWRRDGTQFWGHLAGRRYQDTQGNDLGLIGVITDINARRQVEEQVSTSENRMRSIIESLPIGMHMYHLEADGRLVFIGANPAAEKILGVDHSSFVGKTIEEAFPLLKATEVPQRYREAAASGTAWSTDQIEYHEGAIQGAFVVHAFQTAPNAMVAAFADITVRKRAELDMQRSEAKYRRLYNATPVLLHSIDRNGIVAEVNDHWLQTLGYERREVLGRKVTDFYTEASRKYAEEVVLPAFFRGDPARDIPYQFVKKSGEVVDVLLSASAERDAAGNAVRSQSVIIDVTDRRRAEAALRQSEERFRLLVEHSPIALSIIEATGRIEYINEKHTEITGYTIEEVPTLDRWWEIVYPEPESAQRAIAAWGGIARSIFSGEVVEPVERTIVCKDGSSKDVELRFSLNGEKILSVLIDITQRKKAEAALLENQARLDLALQSAHMGVWRWEIGENRRYFDELTCQLLGIEAATFSGTAEEFFQAVHPEDRETIKAALAGTIEKDLLYEPTYRAVWPDGSIRYLAARGRLVRDDGGLPVRINGILWDITDQRLLEQERIKVQQFESVGTLAGGIAHDFNNLLTGRFRLHLHGETLPRSEREVPVAAGAGREGAAPVGEPDLTAFDLRQGRQAGDKDRRPPAPDRKCGGVGSERLPHHPRGHHRPGSQRSRSGRWTDRSGDPEHRPERRPGDAARGLDPGNASQHCRRGDRPAGRSAGRPRGNLDPGPGHRHPRKASGEDLRPLLHDQGERERAGARHLVFHHQEPRGPVARAVRGRQRNRVCHLSSRRRRSGGRDTSSGD